MGQSEIQDAGQPEAVTSLRELRRPYHDRIADVRERSLQVLRCGIEGVAAVTQALVGADRSASSPIPCDNQRMQVLAATVDAEVVSLLALEAPVARDLRLILVARDVTQISLLCTGLCSGLAGRVMRAAGALTPELRRLAGEVGAGTEGLLQRAEAAWAGVDPEMAAGVLSAAVEVRTLQTRFISVLIGLTDVPMDAAIDLAMVARAYERLADHAVEVAERALFAVNGSPLPPG
ncbi:MAG TPA: PhoU domain-containing protein [Acidimicrobiales bacterium]|nr:PhoU domain-containing protein [Acidimicrobiales bacterium]